jgi:hypothetical protein
MSKGFTLDRQHTLISREGHDCIGPHERRLLVTDLTDIDKLVHRAQLGRSTIRHCGIEWMPPLGWVTSCRFGPNVQGR